VSLPNTSGQEVSRKFGVHAPTLLSEVGRSPPVCFSLVCGEQAMEDRSEISHTEDAYVIHVHLRDVPIAPQLWINSREQRLTPLQQGGVLMANLQTEPTIRLPCAFRFVRCYFSQETLDELDDAAPGKGSPGLRRPPFGAPDPILFRLASAAVSLLQRAEHADQVLIDELSLVFHRRLSVAYGGAPLDAPLPARRGLASWQARRVTEYVDGHLAQSICLQDLAGLCDLSPSHFVRAFKRNTGRTPHRWLLERRVEAAKTELLRSDLPLADIYGLCGFSDASHFSRVFRRITGETPAQWRRRRASCAP
jgi:AraC family transcriptional regulator